jgi:hypothetical protein
MSVASVAAAPSRSGRLHTSPSPSLERLPLPSLRARSHAAAMPPRINVCRLSGPVDWTHELIATSDDCKCSCRDAREHALPLAELMTLPYRG